VIRSPNDWYNVVRIAENNTMNSLDFAKFVLHELRGYKSRLNKGIDPRIEDEDARTLANLLEAVRQLERMSL
jgi:hypothetical protein